MPTETPIGDCDRCGRESVALCSFCDECMTTCCTLTCRIDYPADDASIGDGYDGD